MSDVSAKVLSFLNTLVVFQKIAQKDPDIPAKLPVVGTHNVPEVSNQEKAEVPKKDLRPIYGISFRKYSLVPQKVPNLSMYSWNTL